VGTKCNSLLLVDVVTRRHRRVALPPKPAVRQAPELMYNPDGHCGMHAMDVSPDGRYVVTGGRAAEDAVVLRRDTLTPVQTFSVRLRRQRERGLLAGVAQQWNGARAAFVGELRGSGWLSLWTTWLQSHVA
jgi:hypothetical protein